MREGAPHNTIVRRHNLIKVALKKLLQKAFPFADIQMEQLVPNTLLGRDNRICDIVIHGAGAAPATFFDVSVTNQSTGAFVRTAHTDEIDLAGAQLVERMKTALYVKSLGPDFRPHFQPFILEATGAYGPRAAALLDSIVVGANPELIRARKEFFRYVSVVCARTNGTMIALARGQMRRDAPPPYAPMSQIQERNIGQEQDINDGVWPTAHVAANRILNDEELEAEVDEVARILVGGMEIRELETMMEL